MPLLKVSYLSVARAVLAIPEGFPVAMSAALSIVTSRMAQRNVLVRRLTAVMGVRELLIPVEHQLDAMVAWLARHWLTLFSLGLALFVALPVAAPVLAASGHDRAAGAIYFAYRATCHQLPQRSWFLFGPAWQYSWAEVQPYTGVGLEQPVMAFHNPLGNAELGYQIAFCQRDTAIWWSMFLTTVVLAVLIRRRPQSPLPFRFYAIALIPIALDGVTQLVGLRTSTPLLRTLTGAIFGAATALLIVPYLDIGFRELASTSKQTRLPAPIEPGVPV